MDAHSEDILSSVLFVLLLKMNHILEYFVINLDRETWLQRLTRFERSTDNKKDTYNNRFIMMQIEPFRLKPFSVARQ